MKTYILFVFFNLMLLTLQSQEYRVVYQYDGAGNRTYREWITLPGSKLQSEELEEENLFESGNDNNNDKKGSSNVFEDRLNEYNIKIFPNPTKGVLKIQIEELRNIGATIFLFSNSGQQLVEKEYGGQNVLVDLTSFPSGVYILSIQIDEIKGEWKIVKE